jgi:hypothetical protein
MLTTIARMHAHERTSEARVLRFRACAVLRPREDHVDVCAIVRSMTHASKRGHGAQTTALRVLFPTRPRNQRRAGSAMS